MTTRSAFADSRAMMKVIVSILMAAALGCASDVDLPLELDRGDGSGSESPPDPPPESAPPLGQPAWSWTDVARQGSVHMVDWASDGGLLATSIMWDEDGHDRIIARHEADGALDWAVVATTDEYLTALSATAGGGAVIALSNEDPLGMPRPQPAGLQWYDADGNLSASWRADDVGTEDPLRTISAVQALPDGGVFWVGSTVSADYERRSSVAGLLDAERQLQWLVPIPGPDGSTRAHPGQLALTADGDIVMLGSYDDARTGASASFVLRFGLDGTELWRVAFVGDGQGSGIAVAASGNVVVAGNFTAGMGIGDLELDGEPYVYRHFVAELDSGGQPIGLSVLELPSSIDSDEIGVGVQSMNTMGDNVVVGGKYYTYGADEPGNGFFAAAHRLDGELVSEILFPATVVDSVTGAGPMGIDVTAEGRLALGGSFSGNVDFGDGVVDPGVDEYGFDLEAPFIVVLDPPDSVD